MSEIISSEKKAKTLELKTKKPPMFNVILLNDDFTPMEFVVYVLKEIFSHTSQKANEIMLKVHNEGEASCGTFTKDLAETKSLEVNNLAKINDHPLISVVKPIYD
jgi:ATP-dependent Clp protease adaptor protein ClpS